MVVLPKIYEHALEAEARLRELGFSMDGLASAAQIAGFVRNDSTGNDPLAAAGLFSWIYGTRALRDMLLPKGDWEIDRTDNIEATYNRKTGIKVIYTNVDLAAVRGRNPKAISGKGRGSERMVKAASGYLFPEEEAAAADRVADYNRRLDANVWYLCVSIREIDGEQEIRAELSCPAYIDGGQFGEFVERIFILTGGDGEIVERDSDLGADEEFPVEVSRKK
jgi:hypothetical protein